MEEGGWAPAVPAQAQVQGWDLQLQIDEVLDRNLFMSYDRQDLLFKLLSVQQGRLEVVVY